MYEKWTELVKKWREVGNVLLARDPEDRAGQGLLKCANDLEIALRHRHSRAAIGVILVAAGAFLINETLPERLRDHTEVTQSLIPPRQSPIETPSIPGDHTEQERGEQRVTIRVSSAASGTNTASHTVSTSAGLSFESLRRVESPIVLSGDFDYTILDTPRGNRKNN
jgi:hypothetical protein